MTKPRAAALLIALALGAAGCTGPETGTTTPPATSVPTSAAAVPSTEAPVPTDPPQSTTTTTSAPATVTKDELDALSVKCASGKVTGTATEVHDTCYCVGYLITTDGTMAGQMPDGRPVADTCPALIAKARG